MNRFLFIILILCLTAGVYAAENNCLTCHQDWEEDDGPSHKIARDIHYQKGLTCVDCHGGDPALEDMDEVRESGNYRGVPDHLEVPDFCARCHSDANYMRQHNPALPVDQLAKYKTSVHGQRIFEQKDIKAANCISCHTVHEIQNAKLPHSSTYPQNIPETCGKCHANIEYMAGYNIATDQLTGYKESVHGQALLERNDLGAPACNDCHGNHGAAPPEISSVSAVCGMCHALEAALFNESPHAEAYAENDFPMCETCHSNHKIIKPGDHLIGSAEPALCADCHDSDDGTIASMTADSISSVIHTLIRASDQAKEVLADAQHKGMMTIDEEFLMKEVDQALIQTRTMVHSFNIDSVLPKAKDGITKAESVRTSSAGLVDEYYFRRKGLGVATILITFLVILLYRKIRRQRS